MSCQRKNRVVACRGCEIKGKAGKRTVSARSSSKVNDVTSKFGETASRQERRIASPSVESLSIAATDLQTLQAKPSSASTFRLCLCVYPASGASRVRQCVTSYSRTRVFVFDNAITKVFVFSCVQYTRYIVAVYTVECLVGVHAAGDRDLVSECASGFCRDQHEEGFQFSVCLQFRDSVA